MNLNSSRSNSLLIEYSFEIIILYNQYFRQPNTLNDLSSEITLNPNILESNYSCDNLLADKSFFYRTLYLNN